MKTADYTLWRDAHGDLLLACPTGRCRAPVASGATLAEIQKAATASARNDHPAGRCPNR